MHYSGCLTAVAFDRASVEFERLTLIPGKTNKLAIIRQKLNIFKLSHSNPMKAKTCVVGDAQ